MAQTIKSPKAPKKYERVFAEFATYMIEQIGQRFENQAIGALQVKTVEKFSDAQVGNYATVFLKLSSQVRRKLMRQFDNKRIQGFVGDLLRKVDKYGQEQVYRPAEDVLGIDIKQLLAKDISSPQVNALILESTQWVKKLRDETLESFTSETLRQMSLGNDLNDIMANTRAITSKRKNHAKFIARNQVSNFNAMTTKLRHQKLGVEKGIWVTGKDERVRACHKARDGKEFDLSEGLYSSCDGKTLFPGTDFQCFPGDSKLNHTSFCEKLYRRWYTGKLVSLVFDDGVVLRATPNHPILTDRGFKAAHLIDASDNIVRTLDESVNTPELNGQDFIPTFEEIFSAFDLLGVKHSVPAGISGEFHGDVSDSDIDVIELDSLLMNVINPLIREKFAKLKLSRTDEVIIFDALTCLGKVNLGGIRSDTSKVDLMRCLDLIRSSFLVHLTPLELFGFTLGTWNYSHGKDAFTNNPTGNTKMFRDCIFAFSVLVHGLDVIDRKIELISLGLFDNLKTRLADPFRYDVSIEPDNISSFPDSGSIAYKFDSAVDCFTTDFSGHVFNLQSISHDYITETTCVSNCRCTYEAVLPELEGLE